MDLSTILGIVVVFALMLWTIMMGGTIGSVSVLRFFTESQPLPLDRMSAVGYGYERPVVTNTSEQNRAKNRRVDLVLRASTTPGVGNTGTRAGKIPLQEMQNH